VARRDDFRHVRPICRLWHGIVLTLLALAIVLSNRLAWRNPIRHGSCGVLQPSEECVAIARTLGDALQFYVVYDDADGFEDAEALRTALEVFLENTAVAMARGGVSFSYSFQHRVRNGSHLRRWFAPLPISGGFFLRVGDRIHGLSTPSCYVLRNGEVRGFSFGTALLAALRSLANPNPPIILFSSGHGERSPDQWRLGTGLARLALWIGQQGWRTRCVDGQQLEDISASNSLLLIVDPRTPFSPAEQVALQRFLGERNGRILLILTPESRSGLDDLLFQWNVLVDEDFLEKTAADWGDGVAVRRFASMDFLRPLLDYQLPVQFESVRQVREDIGGAGRVRVTPFLEVANGAGRPPLPIAVLATSAPADGLPIHLPSGELAVVGGDFLSNQYFSLLGNQLLFQQLANHFLEIATPATAAQPDEFRLNLSRAQLWQVGRTLLLGPILLLVPAILIWPRRR
jgi:hypothetical protein